MNLRNAILIFISLVIFVMGNAGADDLTGKIRAAESDLTVFCPVIDADYIQWSALLYLNQQYGAEIYIGILHPSAYFGCKEITSSDGQFHLAYIGYPPADSDSMLVDSVCDALFADGYPNMAIFEAAQAADSAFITYFLRDMRQKTLDDSLALSHLERIYIRGTKSGSGGVIFNDSEIYDKLKDRAILLNQSFSLDGPLEYKPDRFRWYYPLEVDEENPVQTKGDFLSGMDVFRLPDIIAQKVIAGPEQKNLLNRLSRFMSFIRTTYNQRMSQTDRLRLLLNAYGEISRLVQMLDAGSGNLRRTRVPDRAKRVRYKTSLAVAQAVGINWSGNLQSRNTPFGKTGKLLFDLELTGSLPIELSHLKFLPAGQAPVEIESISSIVTPHQKLHREYAVDLSEINLEGQPDKEHLFAIEIVIEGMPMELFVPYNEYVDEELSLTWLPGYAILSPFREGDITSLAQPFDWQLLITKPYQSELKARLLIDNPDAIVVGSYKKDIVIPEGVTSQMVDIHLAAGRSIGYGEREIVARLVSNGNTISSTSADARIVRFEVPPVRDIAFVPDKTGQLEDILRMVNVSGHVFTPHSISRATLEAYDLLIIGTDAGEQYAKALRKSGRRLRRFVREGGEILILGQSFGWPHDIFDFSIFTSENVGPVPLDIKNNSHRLINEPYAIEGNRLAEAALEMSRSWSAIFSAGDEIISAGELGSYLRVTKIGEGHVIYCGLPLLDMASKLDVDAIHLLANILNFGHGR
ncbi:MAG: hypothetical protein V3V99_14600 [candidate division Zixibacteria bacterium]